MVTDPRALQDLSLEAARALSTGSGKQDPRAQQAQLSFSAMLSAVQSGCSCEACQLLREAVETMRVRPKQEVVNRGPSDNPQT